MVLVGPDPVALPGFYVHTDATGGVWKAPVGTDANLRGVTLTTRLSDFENGSLKSIRVDVVLRSFPVYGDNCWTSVHWMAQVRGQVTGNI